METPTTADAYAVNMSAAQMVGTSTALTDCLFVAFDTETTGLSPLTSRLVELSGVKFRGNGEEISTFSSLINPGMPIPPRVTAVHGITDAMVVDAPSCDQVLPKFLSWLNARGPSGIKQSPLLIAHNASFDISFLDVAMARLNLTVPENQVIDTLRLSRKMLPDAPNHQLRTLTRYLGVESTTYHRALADSQHVRQVFLKCTQRMMNGTLEALLALSSPLSFSQPIKSEDRRALLEQPVFRCLQEAMDNQQSVLMQYSGQWSSTRVVTPKTVLFSRGNYYLQAFCHRSGFERTFRLDKISRMEIVSDD